jgi:hypothetical protein
LDGGHEKESWFNKGHRDIPSYQATWAIDNNIAKLGKNDTKFFLVNISLSQKETAWLKEQYAIPGRRNILSCMRLK